MSNTVRIRFKSYLPGGGFDSAGNPKQGKTRVVGEVDVDSYEGGEGEPFAAGAIALNTIDAISLKVRDGLDGNADGGSSRDVHYATSTGHFYLTTTLLADGVVTHVAPGATETLTFDALGDSANDVELT